MCNDEKRGKKTQIQNRGRCEHVKAKLAGTMKIHVCSTFRNDGMVWTLRSPSPVIIVIISFASVLCVPTHFPNIVNTFSYMFKIF